VVFLFSLKIRQGDGRVVPKTTLGKEAALTALAERRECNKKREQVANASFYAGSEVHFDCVGCGDDIVIPENYIVHPKLCSECKAMNDLGWLQ